MIETFVRIFVPATVILAVTQTAVVAAEAEYGEYLSAECVTCHQLSGADDGIPPITGWDIESFVAVLKSYKEKERENQAMQLITSNLGEEEMAALAAYFATLKPGGE